MRKLALVALLLVPASPVLAQSKGTEVGVGLAAFSLETCSGCDTYTQFQITPTGATLGFYLSEKLAIEPGLALWYSHSGGESFTSALFQAGVPIYLKEGWGHEGVYVEPMGALLYSKASGSSSETRLGFGGEVGTKKMVSDMVSLRFGVGALHVLKKALEGAYTTFTGRFGVSIFFN